MSKDEVHGSKGSKGSKRSKWTIRVRSSSTLSTSLTFSTPSFAL